MIRKQVSCLILAAGRSLRMQGPNKLLLDIGGETLVHRTVRETTKIPFTELLTVTGHDHENIQKSIQNLPTKIIFNEKFQDGMHSSIRKGLENLQSSDGFFICLADQPGFDHQILLKMIEAFEKSSAARMIVVPTCNGQRGHPVLISSDYIPEIFAEPDGDFGCAYLLKRHENEVLNLEINNEEILKDIDEPQQYQDFLDHPNA